MLEFIKKKLNIETVTKRLKISGLFTFGIIAFGLLILFNYGKAYYWLSLIDFNNHQSDREKVVEMIKTNKLSVFFLFKI